MESLEFELEEDNSDNQIITDYLLTTYPKFFEEFMLDKTTNIGVLSNNRRISDEDKEMLPDYDYMVASKHGLTLFNCSYSPLPLEWERLQKAINYLIENSRGEVIEDILISHWHPFHRIRKTKGLLKLKKNIKSVLITGIHIEEGLKDFCDLINETSL